MLPDPTYAFTVPSIHDLVELECRIYHPPGSAQRFGASGQPWHKRGAVVAHPYAPLGGCFDDSVVQLVANEFLSQGHVVCTFNFR